MASRTLENPRWARTTVVRDVPGGVAELKRRPGRPIFVLGNAKLAQTLIEHQLIDEYQLWVHPVVVGGGKTLFRNGDPFTEFALVHSRTSSAGLVILTYARLTPSDPPNGRSRH